MRPRVQTILARIDALKSNHPQLEAAERTRLLDCQAEVAESEAECRERVLSRADALKGAARFRRNHRIALGFNIIMEICMITEGVALFMLGLAIHP